MHPQMRCIRLHPLHGSRLVGWVASSRTHPQTGAPHQGEGRQAGNRCGCARLLLLLLLGYAVICFAACDLQRQEMTVALEAALHLTLCLEK